MVSTARTAEAGPSWLRGAGGTGVVGEGAGGVEEEGEGGGLEASHLLGTVPEPEVLVESAECAPHCRIEVVLDGVVGPSRQFTGDVLPAVAESGVGGEECGLLVGGPGRLGDGGRELVVPPA